MIWSEMSQGWTNVVSRITIKNPITKRRKKFITNVCCHVGRDNRGLIRALSLDLHYCKRANNVWYCLGVKLIYWECTSDLEPSWFYWLLLQFVFKFLNLNKGVKNHAFYNMYKPYSLSFHSDYRF